MVGSALLLGSSASAVLIYDNSGNPIRDVSGSPITFPTGTREVGDEIILAGTERLLQQFDFQYYARNSAGSLSGTISAQVRFYLNNGPPSSSGPLTPGPVPFYQSSVFPVPFAPTGNNFNFNAASGDWAAPGLLLPVVSNMTWSVQFSGLGAGDDVGLVLFHPPVVGGNYPDFWEFDGTTWTLNADTDPRDGTLPYSFGARFDAVPEPSTVFAGALTALSLLVVSRRFKFKS